MKSQNISPSNKYAYLSIFAVILFLCLAYLCSLNLDSAGRDFWIHEGGVVETVSALSYFFCAAFMLFLGGWAYVKKYHYCFMLVLIFGMREMDFDKRFTTMGMLKSKFYVSPDVSLIEKAIGLIVISVILYIAFRFIKSHSRTFIGSVLKLSPAHIAIFLAVAFAFISKTLDGITRKLGDIGITVNQNLTIHFEALEEIIELGIPVMLTLAVYFFLRKAHHANS